MVPRIWKLIKNKTLRLAPATLVMSLAIFAVLVVAGLAAVVIDWPQYQRDSQHNGALKVAGNSVAPILPTQLIWSLKTGGAVRSTSAYVPEARLTTLALVGRSASIAADGTALTVNDPSLELNIGDPLFIGNPLLLDGGEYLGPIIAITRTVTQAVVTVRYAPENAYTLQPLQLALYRQDQLKTAFTHLPVVDAKMLVVKNPQRFMVGDLIMVLDDDPANNETGTIKDITGATITLENPLQKDHPSNSVITAGLPATPVNDGMLYVGSDDNFLYAIDPVKGTVCWQSNADYRLGAVRGAPLIDSERGRVYAVSNSGRIFAFSFSGELLWSYPEVNIPAVGQIDAAAVLDADGNIYFAAKEGAKDAAGKVTPATLYSLSPSGTLNNTPLALTADYQPGGLAIYQINDEDDATFRVLLSTRFEHTSFATAIATAASDTIELDSVGPATARYFAAGDVVKVMDSVTNITSYFTVADVQTGAIRLTQALGVELPVNSQVTISKGELISCHADLAAASKLTYPTGAAQAAPVVGADGMIYLGDASADMAQQKIVGRLHAIHEVNGALLAKDGWLPPLTVAPILHPAAVNAAGTRVIVGDSPLTGAGAIYVYATDGLPPPDPRDYPALLHTLPLDGALSGALTLDGNGKVLANSTKGTAYCFDTEANLFAELWHWNSKTDGGMPAAFPLRTAPTLAGVLVLLGSDDGRVYALGTEVPLAPGGTEQLLPLPSAKWPFFHRDGRRQGSVMDDLLTFEPGAFQPTLRWFNSHAQPLLSSPVVSSNTPDGQARVYVASEDGRIYGYNASNGSPLSGGGWSHLLGLQSQSGWVDLPNSGPVRATPAVAANGNIAVGSVDGHFYLLDSNGSLLQDSWDNGVEQQTLFGDFTPSPVVGKNGTIYAVTSSSLDNNGTFSGIGIDGATATLNDGIPENGYVTLTQPGKLIYTVTDTTRTLAISRIRIYTRDNGTLHIYKLASDDGTSEDKLPIYSQAFKASATASYHDIDIKIEAQKIEWVNESPAGEIAAFEVFSTGSLLTADLSGKFYDASLVAPQPALNPAVPSVALPYLNVDSVEARFASPIWIKSVAITTANAYKIYLVDANGVTHNDWATITAKTASATDTISIERQVSAIGWTKTDAGAARLEGFTALRRDLTNCSHIYAFAADGSIKWSYPAAGEELAPIVASPMMVHSGIDDIIYVVTSGGTVLAVRYDGVALAPEVLWQKELFTPVVAAPVAVDSWPNMPDIDDVMKHFIAVVDTLGAVHLIKLDGSSQRDEWQASSTSSNALAVTAQGTAYLVTDSGDIYRIEFDPTVTENVELDPKVTTLAKVKFIQSLPSSVYSSPVIDSNGRIFFGTDSGSLYCLNAGAKEVRWIFTPQRGTINATLTSSLRTDGVAPFNLQVSQTAGLRVGDSLWISHADGSALESLGQILSLTPPANPKTTLSLAGPTFDGQAKLRRLVLADDLGVVGDTVTLQSTISGQPVVTVGKIAFKAAANTIDIDTDIDASATVAIYADDPLTAEVDEQRVLHFATNIPAMLTEGLQGYHLATFPRQTYEIESIDTAAKTVTLTATPTMLMQGEWVFEIFPINSVVMIGSASGTVETTQAPTRFRPAGDIISNGQSLTLPLRTSPAIGPAQTVFIGGVDGVLYAVGPWGPAGIPAALPSVPGVTTSSPWYTFHRDNQRTGYVDLPGPIDNSLRWYRNTGSTLESSPALGYADAYAKLGLLYVGSVDETVSGNAYQQRGSMRAYDASTAALRWYFNDNERMGKVYSSPAVFTQLSTTDAGAAAREEYIVFGTVATPSALRTTLLDAMVFDPLNPLNLLQVSTIPGAIGLMRGQAIAALRLTNVDGFRVGQRVYISDSSNGANLETAGTVLRVVNDWVYLADNFSSALTCLRDHIFTGTGYAGSIASSTASQQGQVYCMTRAGKMAWKYPAAGAKASEQIGGVKSSPVVDSQTGNIFIATSDALIIALDANGRKLWDFAVQLPVGVSGSPEITSSPALDGLGHLYIGVSVPSTNKGYLLALNTAPSSQKRMLWMQPFNGPITASPMVSNVNQSPRIYIGIDDFSEHYDEHNIARFFAIDPADGTTISSVITAAITSTAAAVPEGNSVSSSVSQIVQVDVNNKMLTVASTTALDIGMRVKVVSGVNTVDSVITALTADTVTIHDINQIDPAWLNAGGKVSLRSNEQMIIVGTQDGKLLGFTETLRDNNNLPAPLWEYPVLYGAAIRTSPAISTEVGRVGSIAQNIRSYTAYFGANDHYLYAITFYANKRVLRWKKDLRDRLYASPVVGLRMNEQGRAIVYQASRDHYLYAFGDTLGYIGNPMDPNGPEGPWTPPEDQNDPLVPSTLEVSKTAERAAADDPNNPDTLDPNWWKCTITVRNSGRGMVDNVTVTDYLPETLSSNTPPVVLVNPVLGERSKLSRPISYIGASGTLNDMLAAGNYTGTARKYEIQMVNIPLNSFRWHYHELDANGNVLATLPWQPVMAITGTLQNLIAEAPLDQNAQALIQFSSIVGHADGSSWSFIVSPDAAQWDIVWSNIDNAQPFGLGDGFSFRPDKGDPAQLREEYQRTFIFYVHVKSAYDPYSDPDPLKHPRLLIDNADGSTGVSEVKLGDSLTLQLEDHPKANDILGVNKSLVSGTTYNGTRDPQNTTPVWSLTETPLTNDWTDSFMVRLYYNGFVADNYQLFTQGFDPETGRLKTKPTSDTRLLRTFSPWNLQDMETGDPQTFTLAKEFTAENDATDSTFSYRLAPEVVGDNVEENYWPMPYAWRVTVQQGRARMRQLITRWSVELPVEMRINAGKVMAAATVGAGTITVDQPALIRAGRILLIDNPLADDLEVLVTLIDVGGFQAEPMTVLTNDGNGNITYRTQIEANAKIYDAWGPDFIIANPVKATNTVGEVGEISLGEDVIPGHTGTSPLVTLENDSAYNMQPGLDEPTASAPQNSGVDDFINPVRFAPFRYRVSVADLRRRNTPLIGDDWNDKLTNDAYLFGESPSAGSLWDGFRYDPYKEFHIPMGDWTFDLPNGAVLREGQTVPLRLTRMIPRHQPDSADNGYYQTPQSEWLKETVVGSNRWYLDIDHDDIYTKGVDFMQNWPSWSQLYLDRNLNGVYNPGEPCLAVGSFDTALYLDINANGVRDRFEPTYSPADIGFDDYGSRSAVDYPQGMNTKLGVAPITGFRLRNTMFDLGAFALASPYTMPPLTANLENNGNSPLSGIQVRGGSLATLVNQDQTSWLHGASGELYRTGFAATRAGNTTVELRPTAELQPFFFNMALPQDWAIMKSPAGSLMDYGRDFQFAIPGINYRQPSGTYAGVLAITNNGVTDANSMISLRVRENRFSQVALGLSGADPRPAIDGTKNAIVPTWTNYLTGTESWPTATVLPDGDLGVFVSSDTPAFPGTATLAELQPTATTDTNIWYRRAKRLVYDAHPAVPAANQHYAAFAGVNVTSITLFPAGEGVKVRRGVNSLVSDLVILRKRIANAGEAAVPAWYGKITGVLVDTMTVEAVNPGYVWAYPDSETIVEVMGHPWVPVIKSGAMDILRLPLHDPGIVADPGPKPIRCITPSVTQVENGLPWLAWSVSTVRSVTNPQSGQKDSFPYSYLAFKRFNPDNPDNSDEYRVVPTVAPGARDVTLSLRERPIIVPLDLLGEKLLIIFEGGNETKRGLYYIVGNKVGANWQWGQEKALGEINGIVDMAGAPQVWRDSAANSRPEPVLPMTALNMVFQARPKVVVVGAGAAKSAIYYARLSWDGVTDNLTVNTSAQLITSEADNINPQVTVERWRTVNTLGNVENGLGATPRIWLYWTRQQQDGLGRRIYYRSFIQQGGSLVAETGRVAGNNVDMVERMLPMQIMAQDGSISVTRMSGDYPNKFAPEAGLWVLSTATRSLFPGYGSNAPAQHDLFLQVLDEPVPDK